MKLTERYIQLCRELAEAGFVWQPRPGDWMLDLNDDSVGMLTMGIENPALLRANNVQIPYGEQIADLLAAEGAHRFEEASEVVWRSADGTELHRYSLVAIRAAGAEDEDEESLVALVALYRRKPLSA
jgi:hypothetical protein